jgi:hypothetical protein
MSVTQQMGVFQQPASAHDFLSGIHGAGRSGLSREYVTHECTTAAPATLFVLMCGSKGHFPLT